MDERNLESVAFPTLAESDLQKLSRCAAAKRERYPAGSKLFEAGSRDYRFFVVVSGEVEIVDESGEKPKTLTFHGHGQFTGEIGVLLGRPAVASAVARTDCEVLSISNEALRQVLNQCPELSEIIMNAFIARRQLLRESGKFAGVRVVGSRYSKETHRVRDFLGRNRVLFTFLDLEGDPEVAALLKQFGLTEKDTPVVAWGKKLVLRNPSNEKLAEVLGIKKPLDEPVYDLAVVGAGPGGLAAAVYGASEGLLTVVLERLAPGGQAGTSMLIENYLGFPTGITGAELAERAVLQANKFGAVLSVSTAAVGLTFENAYSVLTIEGGRNLVAKCLLIVTGADYRRLEAENCERFEGIGVYYAATHNEATLCAGSEVVIVGGGNSAGQAAVFLAHTARKVYVIVRGQSLEENMSQYLARRIEQTPNIEVLLNTEVVRMDGDNHLASVEILNKKTGERRTLRTPALFSFIGAVPRTDWLPPEIEKDEKDFICTGPALQSSPRWKSKRQPFLLETSRAGVFAAGDVRAGSVKRLASAVGEGAMAVQFVHAYLREM